MIYVKDALLQIFITLLPFILFNVYYRDKSRNYSKRFIVITGTISLFLSMTFSIEAIPGVLHDARYVIMFYGLVFGGLQTGFILLIEFVMYRFYLGGIGKWMAMLYVVVTFPVLIIFFKMYERATKYSRLPILFVLGIVCAAIPLAIDHIVDPQFNDLDHAFDLVFIPIFSCFQMWLLIYLFNKAVSDKEFYINHVEDEKVRTIGHVAASLVHEVRNPLTTMKGFLTLIKQSTLDKTKVEKYIDICMDEINRTETILSEYLAISKPLTERKKEQTDFTRLLEIAVDVMTPYAIMNNVELVMCKPTQAAELFINPEEMKQVLVNFLKNSIEACSDSPGGKVSIRLKEESSEFILEIEDNGIGMNVDQVSRLGTIYYSTKTSGTGLGLTYSYQVIRASGGSITVQSEPGLGTVFKINFPSIIPHR